MVDVMDTANNRLWYKNEGEKMARQLYGYIESLRNELNNQMSKNNKNAQLYGSEEFGWLNGTTSSAGASLGMLAPSVFRSPKVNLNVIRSCVDSWSAKLAKNKIKPMFLTDGGTYAAQKKARMLNKFLGGLFYQLDFYKEARMVLRDGGIFGTGFMHIFRDHDTNKVAIERVYPSELLVDMNDAIYGKPRNLYRTRYISKDYLCQLYPQFERDIRGAETERIATLQGFMDCALVIEAWHLPVTILEKDGTQRVEPGKHVISLQKRVLFEEEYKKPRFPFAKYVYSAPLLGYFGTGISEELYSIQTELNRLLATTQQAMRMFANPKIFLEEGSNVSPLKLTNDIGVIVKYRGTPPIYATNPSVNPDIFNQIESLYQKAYQIVGISQLSAQSQKPAGLNSGKALDSFHDIETERFSLTARDYEQFHIDCADIMLDVVQDIVEDTGSYPVTAFSRNEGMERIDFKEIQVDRDGYVMQCWPVSDFPNTPEGKLKFVQDMVQSGLMDPTMAMELFDFPDDQHSIKLQLAPYRLIIQTLEEMLDTGIYTPPEETDILQLALKMVTSYINWARLKKVEDEKIELLRTYLAQVKDLQTAQMGDTQAPPPELNTVPAAQLQQAQTQALANGASVSTNPMLGMANAS